MMGFIKEVKADTARNHATRAREEGRGVSLYRFDDDQPSRFATLRTLIWLTGRTVGTAASAPARLRHPRAKVADRKASILADTGHARREIDHAQESIGKAFPQAAELA
jgi:hypothetical protein